MKGKYERMNTLAHPSHVNLEQESSRQHPNMRETDSYIYTLIHHCNH